MKVFGYSFLQTSFKYELIDRSNYSVGNFGTAR